MPGLKDFRASRKTAYRPPRIERVDFFRLNSGSSVEVEFLRELSDALFVVEHSNPDNWQRAAVCTFPICYGCEQTLRIPYSQWVQKPKMYIDVMCYDEPYVMLQSLTPSSLKPKLEAFDSTNGSIRGTIFLVTKTGEGKKTKHLLEPVRECTPTKRTINLTDYIKDIPYEQQEKYYTN